MENFRDKSSHNRRIPVHCHNLPIVLVVVFFGLIMAEINHQGTVTMPDSFIMHWFIKVNVCKKTSVNFVIFLSWSI